MKGTIKTLSRLCHSDEHIQAKKRLYMTATPKVYSESSKAKAKESDNAIYSMDDEDIEKEIGKGAEIISSKEVAITNNVDYYENEEELETTQSRSRR
ncbi:hypothetical protein ID0233_11810 [Helicobacter pylori]